MPISADFRTNDREDKVVLIDGKTIVGIVVMINKRGVLIIVADPNEKDKAEEVFIPAAKIKEVVRGKTRDGVQGFTTEEKDGFREVTGVGSNPSAGKQKKGDDGGGGTGSGGTVKGPTGPSGPWAPLTPSTPVKTAAVAGDVTAQAKELADWLTGRFPELSRTMRQLVGEKAALDLLISARQSGVADRQLRTALEKLAGIEAHEAPVVETPKETPADPTANLKNMRDALRDQKRKAAEQKRLSDGEKNAQP
jgi:hypothetical protein